MSNVGLFYVGAVLFINALMLLGQIDGKSAAIFNIFVGALQTIIPLYLIMTAGDDIWLIFNAGGIFLFGFTYLYVGITNLANLDTTGLGWYCLWVSIAAIGYAIINFAQFSDFKFGIIWVLWSYLWFLFFLLLGLKKQIGRFTGWVTFVLSWYTATIPAFLILIKYWHNVSNSLFAVLTGLLILWNIILYFRKIDTI